MMKLNCFSWRNAKSPQFAWNIDYSWLLALLLWLWLLLWYFIHFIEWSLRVLSKKWKSLALFNAKGNPWQSYVPTSIWMYIYWFYPRFKTLVADVYTYWLRKTWILFVSGVFGFVYKILILFPLSLSLYHYKYTNVLCTTWCILVLSLFDTRTQTYACVCVLVFAPVYSLCLLFNVYISFYTVQHIGPMNERNIEHMYTQLHTNFLSSSVWWRQCHKKSKPIRIA